jgi:hypothetical protein
VGFIVASTNKTVLITSMKSAPSGEAVYYAKVRGITPTCAHGPITAAPQAITMWMMAIATSAIAAQSQVSYAMASSTMHTITMVLITMKVCRSRLI